MSVRTAWTGCPRSFLPPGIFGYFDDQSQFRDLILKRQLIAQPGARKAALRPNATLLPRHHLACIIDAAFEIFGFLQRPSLRGHETQIQPLGKAADNTTERSFPARGESNSKKITVNFELVKQRSATGS